MGVDERLAGLRDHLSLAPANDVDVETALLRTTARRVRRRRRRRLAVAGACVALTAVVAGSVRTAPSERGSDLAVGVPSGEDASLWVSVSRVPVGTSEVAIAIVADSENPPEVGVYAEVDRWAENDWSLHRRGGLCLDVWLCRRELVSPEDETPPDVEVEDIAVGAGDLLWLPTADLGIGAYRVRLTDPIDPRRAQVVGRFDVVEPAAADVAPPPRSLDGPQLTVSPAVGRARLRHVDIVGVARPQEEGAALWAGIEELPIERWEAGQWASAGSAAVRAGPAGRDVGLPDLEDGAYRVLLDTGTGAEGRFWVVDPHAP